jgi:hypothetical protein
MATTERLSIYEPEQQGLIFPRPPVFETHAEERQHRKERLAAACRAFATFGFSYGTGGHLTVRDPEHHDLYWTNPFAVPFAHVQVSNLVLVDHEGTVVEGRYAANRAGFVLHAAIHAHNPQIVASCHAHTVHGAAWSALGRQLDPVTQDVLVFYDDHVVIEEEAGAIVVPVSRSARRSGTTRRRSTRTTVCSRPAGTASTRQRGGSSRSNTRVASSC